MGKPKFQEIYNFPITEFAEHLQQADNERILFSGKYGIGKTSFLVEFFSKTDVGKQYDAYHLFPVNYSIASNEDIIQHIKHDIILQLLDKGRTIHGDTKSYLENLPKFIKKNLDKVAKVFISMIPKLGKDVVDTYDKWMPLVEEFLKFHDESNSNDGDKLVEYLEKHELKEGGLFETDIITNIIVNMIRDVEKRQPVLIVDDLDRLDPEHVFRIMNVFAAHFDNKVYSRVHNDGETILSNKFGFDKIILVCDFLNVESLFHHKFGPSVDFAGYADKFYSSEIYHFDNRLAINAIIQKLIQNCVKNNTRSDAQFDHYYRKIGGRGYLEALLQFLILNSYINLRSLMRLANVNVQWHMRIKLEKALDFEPGAYPMALEIKILRDCIGDARRFLNIVMQCKERKLKFKHKTSFFGLLLWFSIIDEYVDIYRDKKRIGFKSHRLTLAPHANLDNVDSIYVYNTMDEEAGNSKVPNAFDPSDEDFWDAMILATEKFIEIGYLK